VGRSNTVLIVILILFVLLAGLFGYFGYTAYDRVHRKPEAGGEVGLVTKLKEKEEARRAIKKEIEEIRLKIEGDPSAKEDEALEAKEGLRGTIARLRAELRRCEDDLKRLGGNQKFAEGGTDGHKAQLQEIGNTQGIVEKDKQKILEDLHKILEEQRRKHAAILERLDVEIRGTQDKIREVKDKAKVEVKEVRDVVADLKRERDRQRAELGQYTLGARQELRLPLPTIGEVIQADVKTGFAAIDLGQRHGVKPGFRFEVVQIDKNNRREHKGWLIVRAVEPEMSTCEIVTKIVRLPVCPITGYVAHEPEERYSPMVTSQGEGQHYQRLNATPKRGTFAPALKNPIVKGDVLYNPLFRPGRSLRFVVTGTPIHYDREEVEKMLVFYGGTVEETLSTTADFLVTQRGPKAMGDVQKARELGVAVLYEWELLRFLEH